VPKKPDMPEMLGHFRVVDTLGEGGMGTVYIGVDDTLDRRVALKVIRAEQRLDPLRKARFLREAQILSSLDHPGICQLHDYIEGDEDDCLVLELVDGSNLREVMDAGTWTDADKFSFACGFLDVLVSVHGQGIIHRDLTPFNVMATSAGGVKVLDFGLARVGEATSISSETEVAEDDSENGDTTDELKTQIGSVLGTAAYMSPEQARGEPATAAGDMYSFGLILQELFTNRPPYADNLPPKEIQRRAMWAETEPVTGLPAELTTLIERLTELVPAARPSSVDAAEMLQAIIDRPRRQRRRLLVAAVWFVLAAFGAGMTIQFLRAERASETAKRHAARAESEAAAAHQVSEFLIELFRVSDPGQGDSADVTARELLDAGAERIDSELAEQPALHARMIHTMGIVYHHLGDHDRAAEMLLTALEEREGELGPEHADVADTLYELGLVKRYLGEYEEAGTLIARGLAIKEIALGIDDVETAAFHHQIGLIDGYLGNLDEAETRIQRALTIYESSDEDHSQDIGSVLADLAGIEVDRGNPDEAERLLRTALEINTQAWGPESLEVSAVLSDLAFLMVQSDRAAEAEPLIQQSLDITETRLGPNHPFTAKSINGLAHFYYSQGRYAESAEQLRRALNIYETVYGPDHTNTATALNNLGMVLAREGDLDAGADLLARALVISESALGEMHPDVSYTASQLARIRQQQGRFRDAEKLYRQTLKILEANRGPESPHVASTLEALAACLREMDRDDEAGRLEERAAKIKG